MANRGNPADNHRDRNAVRSEILNTQPKDVSQAMMPLAPGDVEFIFGGLKSFAKKFPQHAEGLVGRVQKMLGATDKEMAAHMKTRARNDWAPKAVRPKMTPGSGEHPLTHAAERMHYEPTAQDAARLSAKRQLPESYLPMRFVTGGGVVFGTQNPMPAQGPNVARASKAVAQATERVITRVEAAIKNALKK